MFVRGFQTRVSHFPKTSIPKIASTDPVTAMDSDVSENHVMTNAALDYSIDPVLALAGASGDPRIQGSGMQHDQAMLVHNFQQQVQYLTSENQWLRDELDISRQELASVCDELKQYRQQQSVSGISELAHTNFDYALLTSLSILRAIEHGSYFTHLSLANYGNRDVSCTVFPPRFQCTCRRSSSSPSRATRPTAIRHSHWST